MNPKNITDYMDAITVGFGHLSDKLKQPASYIFGLAIRQNYATAIFESIQMVVFIFIVFLYVRFIKWGLRKDKDGYTNFYNSEPAQIATFISGLILVFVIIIEVLFLSDIVNRFVNPQWMAIQDIINMVKGSN